MSSNTKNSYPFRILRIDLTTGKTTRGEIDGETTRKYVGGTGLASKYLYEEVPPEVQWPDPENRMMFFTGPLAGTKVSGAGTFSVVSKGPMTNMAGATQAMLSWHQNHLVEKPTLEVVQ